MTNIEHQFVLKIIYVNTYLYGSKKLKMYKIFPTQLIARTGHPASFPQRRGKKLAAKHAQHVNKKCL